MFTLVWGWGQLLWGQVLQVWGGDGNKYCRDGWGWGQITVPMQLSSFYACLSSLYSAVTVLMW